MRTVNKIFFSHSRPSTPIFFILWRLPEWYSKSVASIIFQQNANMKWELWMKRQLLRMLNKVCFYIVLLNQQPERNRWVTKFGSWFFLRVRSTFYCFSFHMKLLRRTKEPIHNWFEHGRASKTCVSHLTGIRPFVKWGRRSAKLSVRRQHLELGQVFFGQRFTT